MHLNPIKLAVDIAPIRVVPGVEGMKGSVFLNDAASGDCVVLIVVPSSGYCSAVVGEIDQVGRAQVVPGARPAREVEHMPCALGIKWYEVPGSSLFWLVVDSYDAPLFLRV